MSAVSTVFGGFPVCCDWGNRQASLWPWSRAESTYDALLNHSNTKDKTNLIGQRNRRDFPRRVVDPSDILNLCFGTEPKLFDFHSN